MASSALEEKINKIRQQNEEIRRRYEEVEEDKKNAAKLNALVQMVPSTDWPERKEPPEFSNPPKPKPKSTKEKHEYIPQSHAGEGKKGHTFAQGEGPPPDPKYNFLADSEREEPSVEYTKESTGNRPHHKVSRGSFRKKDNKPNKGNYRDESQPGYDAWRAERNRIDEDRISRQRTAEGNWRREWDNDKVHIIDDVMKKSSRPTLGDFAKRDHKDSDRRYHANNNEHVNYNRGGHRGGHSHRGSTKNFYTNYENRSHNTYDQHRNNAAIPLKAPVSPTSDERTVVATEKSIKVTVNQSNVTKGPVMSVKVNSPSIAGTGRVGPRQRTRVTYSHSDADAPPEVEPFYRQKSFEDKTKGSYFNNQKFSNLKRSHSQKKKENESKCQNHQKKDSEGNTHKHYENEFRPYMQKDQQKSRPAKSPKPLRENLKVMKYDSPNANVSQKCVIQESTSTSHEVKLEQNVEQNAENNVEQNSEHKAEHNVKQDTEQSIERDIEKAVENNVEHESVHNIENNVVEDNTKTYDHEVKSEQIGAPSVDSQQTNIENEITGVSSAKEAETEEASIISVTVTGNPEHVAKENTNESSLVNESVQYSVNNECSGLPPDNVIEGLKKSNNMSSEVLVPSDIQSNEKPLPNKTIEVSKDAAKAVLSHDDKLESLEQVTKQLINDDCDNIEGKVTVQRSAEKATDNSVSSLEDKTNSVIEMNNQSVCNNKVVQEEKVVEKEALNAKKEVDRTDKSVEKSLKDTVNCEVNSENILSPMDADKNPIEESKEKIVETKDKKEGNVEEEKDKTLQ